MVDSIRLNFGQGLVSKSENSYKTLQPLGKGGNASTFLVLATSGQYHGQLFALKVFRRLSKPERRESFLKEIEFLASCSHPAIIRVFDEGVYKDRFPFVVAEYLPMTLRRLMKARTSIVVKLSFTLQLLSALRYLGALSEPVIHRDIKPENIFVKDRTCVLGDFGLLKRLRGETGDDREFFKQSVGPGMPRWYRTPDLVAYAKGEASLESIGRSDIFQLGLVLAEMFTQTNPGVQPKNNDFLASVELNDLGGIAGALGPMIAELLTQMLEMNPSRRATIDTLLRLLQGLFEDAARRRNALEGDVFS